MYCCPELLTYTFLYLHGALPGTRSLLSAPSIIVYQYYRRQQVQELVFWGLVFGPLTFPLALVCWHCVQVARGLYCTVLYCTALRPGGQGRAALHTGGQCGQVGPKSTSHGPVSSSYISILSTYLNISTLTYLLSAYPPSVLGQGSSTACRC